jgi:hypothetical protein
LCVTLPLFIQREFFNQVGESQLAVLFLVAVHQDFKLHVGRREHFVVVQSQQRGNDLRLDVGGDLGADQVDNDGFRALDTVDAVGKGLPDTRLATVGAVKLGIGHVEGIVLFINGNHAEFYMFKYFRHGVKFLIHDLNGAGF